jgi:hypothetical protein
VGIDDLTPTLEAIATEAITEQPGTTATTFLPIITSESTPTSEPPTAVPTDTPVPPSPTPELPTATPTTAAYTLIFTKDKEVLFFVNQSTRDFPLNSFSLVTSGNDVTILSNWERNNLPAGQCLRINKSNKAKDEPLPASCQQENGEPLTFRWKDDFTLHYNGVAVQTCKVKSDDCVVILAN